MQISSLPVFEKLLKLVRIKQIHFLKNFECKSTVSSFFVESNQISVQTNLVYLCFMSYDQESFYEPLLAFLVAKLIVLE